MSFYWRRLTRKPEGGKTLTDRKGLSNCHLIHDRLAVKIDCDNNSWMITITTDEDMVSIFVYPSFVQKRWEGNKYLVGCVCALSHRARYEFYHSVFQAIETSKDRPEE